MTDAAVWQVSFPEPDIAALTIDIPGKGANVFSRSVVDELDGHLSALEQRPGLVGVIFRSGKPGTFIAGADLREFAAQPDMAKDDVVAVASRGRKLFERLTRAPFISVAAIDGACLGGGMELALWCDRRLCGDSPKTQLGLPEVKLGMFPGWGGTVRLPRIVGLANAIEMITGGESIDGRAATLMGLATDVVSSASLDSAAVKLIRAEQQSRTYLEDRCRWHAPLSLNETEQTFLAATAAAYIQQQTKGQYPAPLAALELVMATAGLDAPAAGEQEAIEFAKIFGTPINRALINVFFVGDRNKKDPGVATKLEPQAIKSVGVFGAGIMGAGISAACVKRDLPVTLSDAAPVALAGGVKKILEEASYNKATKSADPQKMLKLAPLVNATTLDAEYANCDIVIEAVVENLAVKQALHARIAPLLKPAAILASNTSAISIGKLAESVEHPERFVGIHFFNPVRQMPLVEVIRGPQTSDQTVATAVAFAKSLGKSPVVVQDGPGFLVNRLLFPYMNEALELLLDGLEPRKVDAAAKSFGMPMGPITLYDVVGLDTALFAGRVMHEAFPDRVVEVPLLDALVKQGRLGQKSGAGFMRYGDKPGDKKDRGVDDPAVTELIASMRRPGTPPSEKQAVERLFLPMLLEATRVLAEQKVRDARDVDLGLIYGIGFPPFKGGLLFWADTIGAAKIVEMLKPYESLGERYRATPLLLELAKSNGKFYTP
ncbi:MAG: enoyl-CoA hydratase/isomerase family protein [Planctomycetaceae bacterium]|nr:enoyl-CoA hydratase/isomerase family protein [Planctomycetaceae bacterium]